MWVDGSRWGSIGIDRGRSRSKGFNLVQLGLIGVDGCRCGLMMVDRGSMVVDVGRWESLEVNWDRSGSIEVSQGLLESNRIDRGRRGSIRFNGVQ